MAQALSGNVLPAASGNRPLVAIPVWKPFTSRREENARMGRDRPDPRHTLARNLRMLMEETKLSGPEVARKAGVSPKTVNNMVNGRHGPRLDHVDAVARVFGLDLWQLIHPGLRSDLKQTGALARLVDLYSDSPPDAQLHILQTAELWHARQQRAG